MLLFCLVLGMPDARVQPELFSMSIGDNIKYGMDNVTQEQVEEVSHGRNQLSGVVLAVVWLQLAGSIIAQDIC